MWLLLRRLINLYVPMRIRFLVPDFVMQITIIDVSSIRSVILRTFWVYLYSN